MSAARARELQAPWPLLSVWATSPWVGQRRVAGRLPSQHAEQQRAAWPPMWAAAEAAAVLAAEQRQRAAGSSERAAQAQADARRHIQSAHGAAAPMPGHGGCG